MLLTFPILCLFYSKPAAPPNKYCLDKRVQPSSLSPDEKAKHSYYSQRYQEEVSRKYIIAVGLSRFVFFLKIPSSVIVPSDESWIEHSFP